MCFVAVVLAEPSGSTSGVEVAQRYKLEPVDFVVPAQHAFEHQFGLAIGIDRPFGQTFINRYSLRRTENGAGGRKNQVSDVQFHHYVQKIYAVGNVVPEILGRVLHRFADEGVGSEVHDGFGTEPRRASFDRRTIAQIAFEKSGALINRLPMSFG